MQENKTYVKPIKTRFQRVITQPKPEGKDPPFSFSFFLWGGGENEDRDPLSLIQI